MLFKCRILRAFNIFVGYKYPRDAVVYIVPQTNLTWTPFFHKVSHQAHVVQNNLENADVEALQSLVSSLLTRANSLVWQKLLPCTANNYYPESSLFHHINSVLLLITDTIFVKLKTEKYTLVIRKHLENWLVSKTMRQKGEDWLKFKLKLEF